MDELWLIGRILFALVFIGSGVGQLIERDATWSYAASKGIPRPNIVVPLHNVAFIVGGLSVVFGVWADLGLLLLIVVLIPLTFVMHQFWRERDPQTKNVEMSMFMKNVSLLGGAVVLLSFFAREGSDALAYTITDGVLGL